MDYRTGFTFLRSYYAQLQIIKDPLQRLQMYEALANYALNREAPDFESGCYSELQQMFWVGVLPLLDKAWGKSNGGSLGGAPKGNTNASKHKTSTKQAKNKQKQAQTSKTMDFGTCNYYTNNYNNIEGEGEDGIFIPPSLEEVLNYCSSVHPHGADGERMAKKFFSYYAARAWKMNNGVAMADWRAALESWCARETEFNHKNNHNDENDKTTAEQCGEELRQQEDERSAAEARLNGEGQGIEGQVW